MTNGADGRRRLRVLATADTLGGTWTHAIELARALGEAGDEVVLATMGGPADARQRTEAAGVPGLELVESAYRLEWMDDPWDDVDRAGAWLLDLEARTAPDVVHLGGYAHAALPWRAPVVLTAHSCVATWWSAVKGEEAPPKYDEYRRRVRRGLAAADLVVAPTAAMLDALQRHHGAVARTRVIPNGRGAERFEPAAGKEPFVLSVGRLWDEAKNVATLARVAAELPWPVRVAGDATHPDGGEARFENCRALGRLGPDEVAAAMARAAVYAHPARYEPFGLAPLEAALSDCALVLGDIPSLREIWGDAARWVDPDDPEEVRAGVAELATDPERRNALAARARRRALALSPRAMADAHRDAYRSVIGKDVVA